MTHSIPEPSAAKPVCRVASLHGIVPYAEALAMQYALVQQRQAGAIPDTLLLLEHPPTITLGRGTVEADLLTPAEALAGRGITVVRVDRGGEITYHAPGQLVGYAVLDLKMHGQDLHAYLRDLEEVIMQTLSAFGLHGERIPGLTGVWVEGSKIAAIGIKVARWVSMHGFALNIAPDLTPMRRDFVPCGIRGRGVTSLAEQASGQDIRRSTVEMHLIRAFAQVFHITPRAVHEGIIGQ